MPLVSKQQRPHPRAGGTTNPNWTLTGCPGSTRVSVQSQVGLVTNSGLGLGIALCCVLQAGLRLKFRTQLVTDPTWDWTLTVVLDDQ